MKRENGIRHHIHDYQYALVMDFVDDAQLQLSIKVLNCSLRNEDGDAILTVNTTLANPEDRPNYGKSNVGTYQGYSAFAYAYLFNAFRLGCTIKY
jgi:hypothetical protein